MPTLRLRSRLLRATAMGLCLAMVTVPGEAQIRPGAAERARELNAQRAVPNHAAAAAAANPAATPQMSGGQAETQTAHIIRHIVVSGTQRVEPTTVLTYVNIREGDTYDPAAIDQAIKTLSATNLFLDIKTAFDPASGTLTIRVTENPIVNQVVFEGNSKVGDKALTKEVQIKPRDVFTRAKVQADVQRIVELYRRNGKFAARVDPQIIQRPQNRVDLIFSIHEGPTTGVSRITFTGNHVFDANTLKGKIATEESAWYKILSTNDNYDPDRLAFDREQLRRFYLNQGYADFKVVSAVAELTPDRGSFYINFTLDEGLQYHFGKISIDSKIKELPESQLLPLIKARQGDLFSQDAIQKAIESLTNAAGTRGYAFAEVHPRFTRDAKKRLINLGFEIVQGPRVYIEKIDITGNTRTLDKVIRREFRLQEGDAFNRVLVDRSRTRIRALGFFKDVQVKNVLGSQPDRTDLTVNVTEQSTGALSMGIGYSSLTSLLGEFAYTDTNWFGRGQSLRLSLQASQITRQIQFSFTEPYFLDRPLSAGFDLYKVSTDFSQANYRSDVTAGVLRLGFPVSEFSTVSLSTRYQVEKVRFFGVTSAVASQSGTYDGIIMGLTYAYSNLDDVRRPTTGMTFAVSQSFAGFTGNMKFLDTAATFNAYQPFFGGSVVGSFGARAGYITGYNGNAVPFNERKFIGGDTFRGFALAGIGPRDINAPQNTGALGGTVFAVGTFEARLPSLLPESYGVSASLFSDFGTLGRLDVKPPNTGPCILHSQLGSCIKDNLAFRASAGISIGWKSPFGPVQIDFGLPIVKTKYDRGQIIHFSSATGL